MKEINIAETLLKEYKDAELVHFVATQLKTIAKRFAEPEAKEDISFSYGQLLVNITELSVLASAVDKRMNNAKDDPKIML